MTETVAIDFFTVHTATFKTLYVFVILSLNRRRVIHFNVTANPTAEGKSLQLTQAFPFDSVPRYLIRDRDGIYGHKVVDTLQALGRSCHKLPASENSPQLVFGIEATE